MYWPYTHSNLRKIPQAEKPPKDQKSAMGVVGHVFPFRVNNCVVEWLTDGESVANHSPFSFSFPPIEMLLQHFEEMAATPNEPVDKEITNEPILNWDCEV